MKKSVFSFIIPLALFSLVVFSFIPTPVQAQVTVCPAGYTCSPIECPVGYICSVVEQPVGCPDGYTCQPTDGGNPLQCVGYIFSVNMEVGSTGVEVVALQSFLIANGYDIPSISSGEVAKGVFDGETEEAVKQFQADHGIPSTGFVGPLTRATLNNCSPVVDASVQLQEVDFYAVSKDSGEEVGQGQFRFKITALYRDLQISRANITEKLSVFATGMPGTIFPTSATLSSSVQEGDDMSEYFVIEEGQSRDFRVDFIVTPIMSTQYFVQLETLDLMKGDPIDFDENTFRTPYKFLRSATNNTQVIILSPNGEPTWSAGSQQTLAWYYPIFTENITKFATEITNESGTLVKARDIVLGQGTSNSMQYTIPATLPAGRYTLKIAPCPVVSAAACLATNPLSFVTATFNVSATNTMAPTATIILQENGSNYHGYLYKVGQTNHYKWWSTNADTFSSYSKANNKDQCGEGPWIANTVEGQSSTYIQQRWAGCVWTVTYTATNSRTGQSASDTVVHTVEALSSKPVIKEISPTSGPAGTVVAVYGSGFGSNNTVQMNGNISNVPSNGTSLKFTIPANTPVDSYGVSVINTANTSVNSNTMIFKVTPAPAAPTITVTSPNGGETYMTGDTVNIKWNSTISSASMVKIELGYTHTDPTYPAGTYFEDWIVGSTPNTGSYNWTIPQYYGAGIVLGSFKVKISATNGASDYSDNKFGIKFGANPSPITVTSPVKGSVYTRGDTVNISWNSDGSDQYSVNLIRTSDPLFVKLILDTTNYSPNLKWTIPNNLPLADDYAIRVNEGLYRQKTGYSGRFSITDASVAPTATFTIEGQKNYTYYPGMTNHYKWSSTNADTFSSSYTATGPSYCGGSTPTPWVANTANGQSNTYLDSSYIGCVWTVTFTAKNTKTGKSASDTVIVKVAPKPIIEITPPSVPAPTLSLYLKPDGGAYTKYQEVSVVWSSTNATSCVLDAVEEDKGGEWSGFAGPIETSGRITTNVDGSSTLTITCTGAGGSTSKSVKIGVSSVGSLWNGSSFVAAVQNAFAPLFVSY